MVVPLVIFCAIDSSWTLNSRNIQNLQKIYTVVYQVVVPNISKTLIIYLTFYFKSPNYKMKNSKKNDAHLDFPILRHSRSIQNLQKLRIP